MIGWPVDQQLKGISGRLAKQGLSGRLPVEQRQPMDLLVGRGGLPVRKSLRYA